MHVPSRPSWVELIGLGWWGSSLNQPGKSAIWWQPRLGSAKEEGHTKEEARSRTTTVILTCGEATAIYVHTLEWTPPVGPHPQPTGRPP
jgi:hypothetical protein